MNIKNKIINFKAGFTLVEFIVYIGIASLILVTVVTAGLNIVLVDAKNSAKTDLAFTARQALEEIRRQIHSASDIVTANSLFNTNPSSLTLDLPGTGNDVVIDTYTKSVNIGGATETITKLRIQEGSADPVDITNDMVNVSNFVIRNSTRGSETKVIDFDITFDRTNPGNDPNYDATLSIETSLSLRR